MLQKDKNKIRNLLLLHGLDFDFVEICDRLHLYREDTLIPYSYPEVLGDTFVSYLKDRIGHFFVSSKIEDLKILKSLNFRNIKYIFLEECGIKDISFLKNMELSSTETIRLDYNKIKTLSVFEALNFAELKYLCLDNNPIKNSSILLNCDFPKLTTMWIDLSKKSIPLFKEKFLNTVLHINGSFYI